MDGIIFMVVAWRAKFLGVRTPLPGVHVIYDLKYQEQKEVSFFFLQSLERGKRETRFVGGDRKKRYASLAG